MYRSQAPVGGKICQRSAIQIRNEGDLVISAQKSQIFSFFCALHEKLHNLIARWSAIYVVSQEHRLAVAFDERI